MSPTMAIRAQADDLGRMVWSIVCQSSDVVRFEVCRTIGPEERSIGPATLTTGVGTMQHVESNRERPRSVETNGGASGYRFDCSEQCDSAQFIDIGAFEGLLGQLWHTSSPPVRDE